MAQSSAINPSPSTSVGCFESYSNFQNTACLTLGDSISCVTKLSLEKTDGVLIKIAKIFAFYIALIPVGIIHLVRSLYNRITDCCSTAKPNDGIDSSSSAPRPAGPPRRRPKPEPKQDDTSTSSSSGSTSSGSTTQFSTESNETRKFKETRGSQRTIHREFQIHSSSAAPASTAAMNISMSHVSSESQPFLDLEGNELTPALAPASSRPPSPRLGSSSLGLEPDQPTLAAIVAASVRKEIDAAATAQSLELDDDLGDSWVTTLGQSSLNGPSAEELSTDFIAASANLPSNLFESPSASPAAVSSSFEALPPLNSGLADPTAPFAAIARFSAHPAAHQVPTTQPIAVENPFDLLRDSSAADAMIPAAAANASPVLVDGTTPMPATATPQSSATPAEPALDSGLIDPTASFAAVTSFAAHPTAHQAAAAQPIVVTNPFDLLRDSSAAAAMIPAGDANSSPVLVDGTTPMPATATPQSSATPAEPALDSGLIDPTVSFKAVMSFAAHPEAHQAAAAQPIADANPFDLLRDSSAAAALIPAGDANSSPVLVDGTTPMPATTSPQSSATPAKPALDDSFVIPNISAAQSLSSSKPFHPVPLPLTAPVMGDANPFTGLLESNAADIIPPTSGANSPVQVEKQASAIDTTDSSSSGGSTPTLEQKVQEQKSALAASPSKPSYANLAAHLTDGLKQANDTTVINLGSTPAALSVASALSPTKSVANSPSKPASGSGQGKKNKKGGKKSG